MRDSLAPTRQWFLVLFVVATLLQAAVSAARPMASYRALDVGIAPNALGFVAAAFALAPLLLALPVGRRIDRHGELPFVLFAAVLLAVVGVLIAMVAAVGPLLLVVAGLGLGHLMFVVGNQTLVGSRSPAEAYDGRFGQLSFVTSLGQFVGPALAAIAAGDGTADGVSRALLLAAGLAACAVPAVIWLAWRDPGPVGPVPAADTPRMPLLTILRGPGMGTAMIASMTVIATMDVLVVYLPLLGEERGLSVATVGALLAIRAAGSMVSRLMLQRLVGIFGRERLMIGSLFIAACCVVALTVMPLPLMFVAMAIAGITLGVCQPLTVSWVAARAVAGSRGVAMSVRLVGNRLGQVVIPIAAGSLAAATGTAGVLSAAGATIAVTAVIVARNRLVR
jgi:MFS family permease